MHTDKRFSRLLLSATALILILACLPLDLDPNEPADITPQAPTPRPKSTPQPDQSLQLENNLPQTRLSPRPSQELPDNHIGVWFEDYSRYYDTDFVYRNGFKRMRIGALHSNERGWMTIINSESLSTEVDDIISEYTENGVEIVLILGNGAGVKPIIDEFTQEDIDIILDYTTFIATHFKGRIAYYEIWNEFGNTPKVNTYANLVEQSTDLIKEIDPDAKVIFGSVPGDTLEGEVGYGEHYRFVMNTNYMWALIDAIDFREVEIDGFSWHPIYDPIPEDTLYQNYPQLVRDIQARTSAKGFTGEYFADELLWHTWDEPGYRNGPPVSKTIAAKYYTRTITEHRGLGVNVTIQTFFQVPFLTPIHNLCDILAGAEPTDITLSLATSEGNTNIRTYAFTLPGGDRLVALWTNDEAVEDDPGVSATLTIPGSSAQRVIGMDVLNGFEQELITETENGDLVIRNLLVKDYPIILRLVGPHFAEPRFVEPTESPVEPVTINLSHGVGEERIPAGTPIQLTIRWGALTEEQVADFLAAVSVTGTLDGQPLPDLNDYWGEIGPSEGEYYQSKWLYPLGVLGPGTHTVEILGTLDHTVTDGVDSNNDGQPDEYSGEVWQFSIKIVVEE